MPTAQRPVSELFDTQMSAHTSIKNTDMSLALEFQKHFSNESRKHGILDHVKHKKVNLKLDKQRVSCVT